MRTRLLLVGLLLVSLSSPVAAEETSRVEARVDGGDLVVVGGRQHGATIDPHNDHRIAMSFAIAGLATGAQEIHDPSCAAKSFPDFWERFRVFEATED